MDNGLLELITELFLVGPLKFIYNVGKYILKPILWISDKIIPGLFQSPSSPSKGREPRKQEREQTEQTPQPQQRERQAENRDKKKTQKRKTKTKKKKKPKNRFETLPEKPVPSTGTRIYASPLPQQAKKTIDLSGYRGQQTLFGSPKAKKPAPPGYSNK